MVALVALLNGCGSGNDSRTALPEVNAFESLQENVLQVHSNALVSALEKTEQFLNTLTGDITQAEVFDLQKDFENIMIEWKSVQSSYVAVDFDSELEDIPQVMDFFHTGNVDVITDVDAALSNTSTNIEQALYKNSSKSITALEYMIFGKGDSVIEMTLLLNINEYRRLTATKVALAHLKEKAQIIADFYKNDTTFIADDLDASNSIVNVLIDSAYRLKDHRLGEAAGLVVKYADRPDPERLEYFNSKLSLVAMKSIVLTHQEIMGEKSYENFASFASENKAGEVVTDIRKQLKLILTRISELSTLESAIGTTFIDPKIEPLFEAIDKLQDLYFESLIQALDLTEEIIESDGD